MAWPWPAPGAEDGEVQLRQGGNPEKSGEIRASEANRLQKQKDKHSERERERYIIYIEAYDRLNHNCIVHQKEYTTVGLCWILVFRWSEDVYIMC